MKRVPIPWRQFSRRGAVVVQVAVMSTMVLGMGALAIDVGAMYTARTELQMAADSAALAAAQQLVGDPSGALTPSQLARTAAEDFSYRHHVMGRRIQMGSGDVEFGRAIFNPVTQKFSFEPGGVSFDAVRVKARRTHDSAAGALPLTFANVFGLGSANLEAEASAVLIPRDIAVVIDLSGSMAWDSSVRFWDRTDGGFPNTRDIWASLDGPAPSRPYMPGSELETEYAGDSGPTVGGLPPWGNALLPGAYSPSSDPGLWNIRKSQSQTSLTAVVNNLTTAGYNSDERTIILSGSRDSNNSHWQRRAGVMLGLASWRSGRPGGISGGNGDTYLDSSEVTWNGLPSYRVNWSWTNFIDYVQSSGISDSNFRYRYGLKTYVDFLVESKPQISQTNNLFNTPEQPLRAVKDAVQALSDTIDALDGIDHMSLEIFATTSRHEVNLTDNYQSIANTLYARQSGHYNTSTNIGAGLATALVELQSSRARDSAKKVVVLMSDGVPNVDSSGSYVGDGAPTAVGYALDQAEIARDQNITVYCVSVGYGVDRSVMQEIAAIANGQEFYAAGNPEEYTEQLQMIFRSLGGRRPVALIE